MSNNGPKSPFREVRAEGDTPWETGYKWLFRYATPNLFMWGPLAPAHDALAERASLATVQGAIGVLVFAGAFRRQMPASWGKLRRAGNRFGCALAGSILQFTALKEISYYMNPESNPLYIEITTCRRLREMQGLDRGSYWFGPPNFMPMTNEKYTQMLYKMEVFDLMADQYDKSELMQKFSKLAHDQYYKRPEESAGDQEQEQAPAAAELNGTTAIISKVAKQLRREDIDYDDSSLVREVKTMFQNSSIENLIFSECNALLNYRFPPIPKSIPGGKSQ